MIAVPTSSRRDPARGGTPITQPSTDELAALLRRAAAAQSPTMSTASERRLADLARVQDGLLSDADLWAVTRRADELRRRVRSHRWQLVLPGVIAPAAIPVSRSLREAAAMLWLPAGALSHFSAARQDDIWVPEDERAWATVPFADRHRSRRGVEIMRTRHVPARWTTNGFLRWTPAARTIVDLGMCLDERELSAALLSAVRKQKTTAAQVLAAAEGLDGRAGLSLVRRVAGLWAPERESLLEDGLYDDVCSVVPSAKVQRQHDVRDRSGQILGRADVAVPELRLVFEADGLMFHSTDAQIAADQRRDRSFLGIGWQTARFREGVAGDREMVRRDIRAMVEARRRQLSAA